MPKLCGLGLSNYIAFFVVLHVIGALELQVPPSATPDGTVSISWTSNSSDPLTFNIILFCSDEAAYILKSSVLTSSQNVTVDMPSSINGQISALLCELQARKLDNTLLNQVAIEVDNPTPNISASSGSSQTSTSSASPRTNSAPSSASNSTSSSDVTSGSIRTSVSPPTTSSTDTSPSEQSSTSSTDTSSSEQSSTSSTDTSPSEQSSTASSTQTSTHPIGAIIGGVLGGLVGLGLLVIFVVLWLCRRRRLSFTPLLPIPLPYDQNYVQPLDKNDYLARIADEREAVRRQRDQLQTEVERIYSRQSAQSGTSETSESGLLEHKIEALSRRILELETQQHELARQLRDGQSPPSYSNLSSAL